MFKPPIIYRVVRPLVRFLLKIVFRIKVEGTENIIKDRNYIIVANLQSWLDPLLIMAYFPAIPQIMIVAEKHGTTNKPFINRIIRVFGNPVIGISRSNNDSRISGIKQMVKELKQGKILLVFPEGRLSRGEGKMYSFYPGAFLVSKKMNLPVVTVGFSGNYELYLRKPIHMKIAEPLYPNQQENVEEYASRAYYYVEKNVIPPYPGDGPKRKYCTWLTNLLLGGRASDLGINSPVIRYKQSKDLFINFS